MKELDEMGKINSKLSAAVEEVTLEHREKREVSLNLLILIPLSRTKTCVSYWIENLNKLSSFKIFIVADREASLQGRGTSKTSIHGLFLQPRETEKPSEGTQCTGSCSPSLILGPHHKYI